MKSFENLSLEDLPNEEWRSIPDFPHYVVSNFARVKRLPYICYYKDGRVQHKGERIAKQTEKDGYREVRLFNEKTGRKGVVVKVHRLVAMAFIPNPENKPYIDHINGIRDDNRIENLRWCTHGENMNNPISRKRHSEVSNIRYLREGEREKISASVKKLHQDPSYRERFLNAMRSDEMRGKRRNSTCCKKVGLFDEYGNLIKKYKSAREASICLGILHETVTKRCREEITDKKTKLTWRYIHD